MHCVFCGNKVPYQLYLYSLNLWQRRYCQCINTLGDITCSVKVDLVVLHTLSPSLHNGCVAFDRLECRLMLQRNNSDAQMCFLQIVVGSMYLMLWRMRLSVFLSPMFLHVRENEFLRHITRFLSSQKFLPPWIVTFVRSWADTKFLVRQKVWNCINRIELYFLLSLHSIFAL